MSVVSKLSVIGVILVLIWCKVNTDMVHC